MHTNSSRCPSDSGLTSYLRCHLVTVHMLQLEEEHEAHEWPDSIYANPMHETHRLDKQNLRLPRGGRACQLISNPLQSPLKTESLEMLMEPKLLEKRIWSSSVGKHWPRKLEDLSSVPGTHVKAGCGIVFL